MALRPAGKTLSSLTGIVVMVAVLWFLLDTCGAHRGNVSAV